MIDSTDGSTMQTSRNQWPTVNSTRDGNYYPTTTKIEPIRDTKPMHPKSFYTKKKKRRRKK